jgi:Fe-S-cluster containining protein
MEFPCTSCGCCCKRINLLNSTIEVNDPEHILYFPYKSDENGRCEKLTSDNKCSVYMNRPLICDIEKIADKLNLDKINFFNKNIDVCNAMMDEDGIKDSLRIKQIY